MSGPTIRELARITDPMAAKLNGAIRRMTASITKSLAEWQVTGVRMLDGMEVFKAELFHNAGFMSRPPQYERQAPEVIVVMASGSAKSPAVIATRDLKTASAVVKQVTGRDHLEPGETIIYTAAAGAVVYLKPDGTIEARSATGTAVELATKADVVALRDWLAGHVHLGVTAGSGVSLAPNVDPMGTPPGVPLPDPVGTTKLKGE